MSNSHEFKAEISQLLEIITHSIYTNREIFIRELISNASDALDKLRFTQSSGQEINDPDAPLEIHITTDKEAGTIVFQDSGIGMTADELVQNIGTIAHSGSAQFMKEAAEGGEAPDSIIGRFGVGFYSVFMAAENVIITTNSALPGSTPMLWESTGTGSYTMEELADGEHPRGTRIEVKLREDAKEYAAPERIRDVIREHSNFVAFPVMVDEERTNTTPALWREPKFKVTEEQYNDFYKYLTYDETAPLSHLHISVDAPVQFNALMFIPDSTSGQFFNDPDNYGLDLYSRRVLIDRTHKDLIPQYLGFMRGLVDTEDLPLNISRETLQENLLIGKIRTTITKQVLSQLEKLANDKEKYDAFWNHHSKVFKLGYSDFVNRDRFFDLVRFNSSADEDAKGLTSLADYTARLKGEQKEVYYLSGPSREAIKLSPHLEAFTKRGIEVLFLYEPIDEFIMESLGQYKDFELVPAEKADIAKLEEMAPATDDADKPEELSGDEALVFEDLLATVKELLGDRVEEVRSSNRLADSPACLVSPDGAPSSQMLKYMQVMTKDTTPPVKVLEINKDHALTRNMLRIFKSDKADPFIATASEQLYESALLIDGYLNDPNGMVSRMNKLLEQASGWYTEIKKV